MNGEVVSLTDLHLAVSAPVGAERSAACSETKVATLVVVGVPVSNGAVGRGGSVNVAVPDDETNSRNHSHDDEGEERHDNCEESIRHFVLLDWFGLALLITAYTHHTHYATPDSSIHQTSRK